LIPKTEIYYASRKTSSAHVYITKGVGKIRINNIPLEMIEPEASREVILAPLEIIGEEIRDKVDISIRVRGGGFMGQAYASATAMTRALIGWTKSKKEPKDHPFNKTTRQQLK
jgi:small subunit ribosomal protein S9